MVKLYDYIFGGMNMEKYELPFYKRSSMKFGKKIFWALMGMFFILLSLVGFLLMTEDSLVMGGFTGSISFLVSLMSFYVLIFVGVLGKFYIKINEESIEISQMFFRKKVFWKEIACIYAYEVNSNIFIAVLLKKDVKLKMKKGFNNSMNEIIGEPPASFKINVSFFSDIDISKLCNTIQERIEKSSIEDDIVSIDNIGYEDDFDENNIIKGVLASFILMVLTSVVYAYSIEFLEKDYIILPIFASMFIISIFNKYYIENKLSVFVRLYLGIICFMQVPLSIILSKMFIHNLTFKFEIIQAVIKSNIDFYKNNLIDFIIVIVVGAICFSLGFFQSRVMKSKG